MKKNTLFFVIISLVLSLLVGCSEKPASIDLISYNQEQGKAVQLSNARNWMTQNIVPEGAVLNARFDTFIGPNCAQGDGYGTTDIMIPVVDDKGKVVSQRVYASLECPTYGNNGCINKEDIKKGDVKRFRKDVCNTNLPAQFPKVTG